MTPRQRILTILSGSAPDRPAVLCPGGMMSMAVTEVMAAKGLAWPAAHADADAMAGLALAMQEATGFDNLAVPFCMTVEAEAYGAEVGLGDLTTQPRVRGTILDRDGDGSLPRPAFDTGRAAVLLDALRRVRRARPDLAVIGNLPGPFSLLGMLADPLQVLRWTRRRTEAAHRYLRVIMDDLTRFGLLQAEAGADAICVADPTATGEILGGELFQAFALPYLDGLVGQLRQAGVRAIVHICGDTRRIERELVGLAADAVSFDHLADMARLVSRRPPWRAMGNVSPFLLESGPVQAIRKRTRALRAAGVPLLAPACGVIPTTPVAHLRAMSEAAQGA